MEPAATVPTAAAPDAIQKRVTVFFHLCFRVLAVLSYLVCTWFSDSFVVNFIVIVALLAADFWTVKNVTGRLLVGLRWWNQVNEDGTSQWHFESRKNYTPHAGEARVFWWSLYIFMGVWCFFGFISLIKLSFSWLLIGAVAISLNTANVVGYTKCQKDAAKKLTSMAAGYLGKQVLSAAMSSMVASATAPSAAAAAS